MKKHIKKLLIIPLLFPLVTFAFRLDPYIEVKNGIVEKGGIMADDTDSVYIEIVQDTRIRQTANKSPYQGDILPPQITAPALQKPPRGRLTHLKSFEILSGDGSPIQFLDKFDLMTHRQRVISLSKTPEDNTRIYGSKLFIRLPKDPAPVLPTLYYFDEEKIEWKRIGGSKNTQNGNPQIFSAQIKNAGRYSLFDENPAPKYTSPTDPQKIIPAGTDPYTFAQEEQQKISQTEKELQSLEAELNQENFFDQEGSPLLRESAERSNNSELPEIIPSIKETSSTDLENQLSEDAALLGIGEDSTDPTNPKNTQVNIYTENQNIIGAQEIEPELPQKLPTAGQAKTQIPTKNLSFPWGISIAILIIIAAIYLSAQNNQKQN